MSLFSVLGKIGGGIIGGLVGGPAGIGAGIAIGGNLAGGTPKGGSAIMRASPPIPSFNGTLPGYTGGGTMYPPPSVNITRAFPQLPGPVNQTGLVNIVRPGAGSTLGPGNQTQSGPGNALVGRGAGTPCASGYHYNKTGYFSKRYGWIEKGTVCVKNRRRNPLNAKALNRAGRRIVSAKKAAHFLDRIHFGAKPTHRRALPRSCK